MDQGPGVSNRLHWGSPVWALARAFFLGTVLGQHCSPWERGGQLSGPPAPGHVGWEPSFGRGRRVRFEALPGGCWPSGRRMISGSVVFLRQANRKVGASEPPQGVTVGGAQRKLAPLVIKSGRGSCGGGLSTGATSQGWETREPVDQVSWG